MPLKIELMGLLAEARFETIADMAADRRRTLGTLISLTYHHDPLICWRAIDAMGLACEGLAARAPATVNEHMRRLNWLITEESGAICWRAPEAMAEISARLPDMLEQYRSIVPSLLKEFAEEDLEHFRAGVLWGIGRLGGLAGPGVTEVLPQIESALDRKESQVRGMAAWCLGRIGRTDLLESKSGILEDAGAVQVYRNRELVETSVRGLADEALADVGARPD